MSRRNAKLAKLSDLQSRFSDVILTKRDLGLIITGLRNLDRTDFTERDNREYDALVNQLSKITYTINFKVTKDYENIEIINDDIN